MRTQLCVIPELVISVMTFSPLEHTTWLISAKWTSPLHTHNQQASISRDSQATRFEVCA